MSESEGPALASLVIQRAVTKLDALEAVAAAADSSVTDAGSAGARVLLEAGAWAEVDIPKFGEPPPLTIDVRSALGVEHARLVALRLAGALEASTDWAVEPDFSR